MSVIALIILTCASCIFYFRCNSFKKPYCLGLEGTNTTIPYTELMDYHTGRKEGFEIYYNMAIIASYFILLKIATYCILRYIRKPKAVWMEDPRTSKGSSYNLTFMTIVWPMGHLFLELSRICYWKPEWKHYIKVKNGFVFSLGCISIGDFAIFLHSSLDL